MHPCAGCCNTGHVSHTYATCYCQNIKHVAISPHLTTKIYKHSPLTKSVATNQSQKQVEIGSVHLDYICAQSH